MSLIRILLPLFLLGAALSVHADEAAERAALEAAAQSWVKAFNARDALALSRLVTDDVVLLDPNLPPVSGVSAARLAWEQVLNAETNQLAATTKELVVAGEIGWRIGALAHKESGGRVVRRGQALEIWKRTAQGWRLHRQMTSSILSQRSPISRPPLDQPALDAPRN